MPLHTSSPSGRQDTAETTFRGNVLHQKESSRLGDAEYLLEALLCTTKHWTQSVNRTYDARQEREISLLLFRGHLLNTVQRQPSTPKLQTDSPVAGIACLLS